MCLSPESFFGLFLVFFSLIHACRNLRYARGVRKSHRVQNEIPDPVEKKLDSQVNNFNESTSFFDVQVHLIGCVFAFWGAMHLPVTFSASRVGSGVSDLGPELICHRIPGLTWKQREMCANFPDAMVAVGNGIRLGTAECQHQFRHHRWNCSAIGSSQVFGHVVIAGSREAAFMYAASSAGVTHSVTSSCSRGNISLCGCDPVQQPRRDAGVRAWKWGGCSSDIRFGMQFARKFLDARETEGDARSLMNLHNNKAGRKVVRTNLLTECKCHGVSGSCTMKTCWKSLPPFRQVGDSLLKKYTKSREVVILQQQEVVRGKVKQSMKLVLKKIQFPRNGLAAETPKKSDLVHLESSPNYCEKDVNSGSLGTVGRFCNRTSKGTSGCDLLCCGRGYNTHQYTKSWQCRCKFHWCCHVNCDTCVQKIEEYTCK